MSNSHPRIGVTDLRGPAVDLLRTLRDDNHSLPADEDAALRNFDSFADSFFRSQREFIRACEREAQDD